MQNFQNKYGFELNKNNLKKENIQVTIHINSIKK